MKIAVNKAVLHACMIIGVCASAWVNAQTLSPAQVAQNSANMAYQSEFEQLTISEQTCVLNRAKARTKAQQRKRGLGRLLQAVGRVAVRTDRFHLAQDSRDATSTLMTLDDLQGAARDLGVVPDDVTACTGN